MNIDQSRIPPELIEIALEKAEGFPSERVATDFFEELYPLTTQKIDINLDDGIKANYPNFGVALKKIPGLDAQDE